MPSLPACEFTVRPQGKIINSEFLLLFRDVRFQGLEPLRIAEPEWMIQNEVHIWRDLVNLPVDGR